MIYREPAPELCSYCGYPMTIAAEEVGTPGVYCSPMCIDRAKARMAKNDSQRQSPAERKVDGQ